MPLSSHIAPDPPGPPSREQIERARSMYAERFTVSRILAQCGMSLGTLYYWLDGGPREDGAPLLPPIARRRKVVGARRRPLSGSRVSLIARLTRIAERQARDIELRLARPMVSGPERERELRMLATLVQSLRGLLAIAPAGVAPVPSEEPDMNTDALRNELARRLHALIDQREAQGKQARVAELGAVSAAQSENRTPAPDAPRS